MKLNERAFNRLDDELNFNDETIQLIEEMRWFKECVSNGRIGFNDLEQHRAELGITSDDEKFDCRLSEEFVQNVILMLISETGCHWFNLGVDGIEIEHEDDVKI